MGFSPLFLSQSLSFILFLFHFHSTISSPLSSNYQSLSLLQFIQSFSNNSSASSEYYCQYPFPKTESSKSRAGLNQLREMPASKIHISSINDLFLLILCSMESSATFEYCMCFIFSFTSSLNFNQLIFSLPRLICFFYIKKPLCFHWGSELSKL